MNRSPLKVTQRMLDAGAVKLVEALSAQHSPAATAHLVFTAMLAESEWSPALRTRPGRQRTYNRKYVRKDFDANGLMILGHTKQGEPIKRYICSYWYLRDEFNAEKARERTGLPLQK